MPGVVGAVVASMQACPLDEVGRRGQVADRGVGDRALRRLRRGDPRFVADATDAARLHGELRPAVGQADLGPLAGEAARQHRVVPVHRPAVLRLEDARVVVDQHGQPIGGGDPVGPRLVGQRGQVGAAAQRVSDRRRAGQQRVVPRTIVGGARPQHGAVVAAHGEHPVEGALHRRPEVVDEGPIPRAQPVVPHAGGDVGADVGVELGLFDRAVGQVVVPPTAVVALDVDQPFVGPLRRRRGSRRRRAPSPSRRGSTDRNARRGTRGSCRCRAAARRSTRRSGRSLRRRSRRRGQAVATWCSALRRLAGVHDVALAEQRRGGALDQLAGFAAA